MKLSSSFLSSKRGQFHRWMAIPVVIAVFVLAFVVIALIYNAFQTTSVYCTGTYVYNTTSATCQQANNVSNTQTISGAGSVNNGGITFLSNLTSQFNTAGEIAGVGLLLLIIGVVGVGATMIYDLMRP